MAADFTLHSRRVVAHKNAQAGYREELHRLQANAANDVNTYELNTTLHKIEHFSVGVVGTSETPYLDEYANTTEGVVNAGGTAVTLTWGNAPNTTVYLISLIGN